jgi:CRISPR/Cas system-associated protein Cas5 (RAMP superfamily)
VFDSLSSYFSPETHPHLTPFSTLYNNPPYTTARGMVSGCLFSNEPLYFIQENVKEIAELENGV